MDEDLIKIIAGVVVTGGAILFFVIKWLLKNISKKDDVIEKMQERSLTAVNNNTNALKELQRLLKSKLE